MGRLVAAASRPASVTVASSMAPATQSAAPATRASASGHRRIVGPTDPSAIRTYRFGGAVTTQALAVAMTIALRTPTLL